jgi:ubiquinone/menaquinone biosynthesis C-methylase UbiE
MSGVTNIERVCEQFNSGAAGYGHGATEWHIRYATRLVQLSPLAPKMVVLDAGCGTGLATFPAADTVGPEGAVIGVDIAEAMVEEARKRAVEGGYANVSFAVGDAASLPEYESRSDVVICSSALIYMRLPDALVEWRRLLHDGGVIAFSTMAHGSPRVGVVFREAAAAAGVAISDPNEVLATRERCEAILATAGFTDVQVRSEQAELGPMALDGLWEAQASAAVHATLQDADEQIRKTAREEFSRRITEDDLKAPLNVLYVVARSTL